jgi:hypothetical protein
MAQATTQILLPQTSGGGANNVVRGTKCTAAAYYLANKDLQTVSWNVTSMTGTLQIQASIVENPNIINDNDWFVVHSTTFTNTTETNYTNITGNFVWLRARLGGFNSGVVQYVRMSY